MTYTLLAEAERSPEARAFRPGRPRFRISEARDRRTTMSDGGRTQDGLLVRENLDGLVDRVGVGAGRRLEVAPQRPDLARAQPLELHPSALLGAPVHHRVERQLLAERGNAERDVDLRTGWQAADLDERAAERHPAQLTDLLTNPVSQNANHGGDLDVVVSRYLIVIGHGYLPG